MAGKIEVDPAAIAAASRQFQQQYGALVRAITSFQSDSLDVDDAFGFLGPSVSLLRQYENVTESAFRGLDQLAKLLTGAARALTQTSSNYAAADAASSLHGN